VKLRRRKPVRAFLMKHVVPPAALAYYRALAGSWRYVTRNPEVFAEIQALEAKGDYNNPRYMELLIPNFYNEHICRLKEWPEALNRSMKHLNSSIYVMMQGPSEFGVSGRLTNWDVKNRLQEITIPTLMIGAKYDTMDPKAMEEQSKLVKKGRFLYCPNGSHLSMWDDQKVFMNGVVKFINEVNASKD
jgi:proline iminopeptidase